MLSDCGTRTPSVILRSFQYSRRVPRGVESVLSQADVAQVRPGLSVADHNKERKVNSKLLTPTQSGSRNMSTALRSRNMSIRTAALAAAWLLGAGAIWAQSPPAAGSASGTKVGVISIRQAIVTTAEGKLASAELQSQFASRQNEIENLNKQINDLQQRLTSGGGKLSQEEESRLRQQGQRLAQRLERMNTEYQEDVNAAQADVIDRIGRKMVDVLDRYSRENGFVLVLDSSAQNTPILYNSSQIDVTQDIIRLYDQAYPVKTGATTPAKPAATKPAPTAQPPASKP
jgi:outer membrane protein